MERDASRHQSPSSPCFESTLRTRLSQFRPSPPSCTAAATGCNPSTTPSSLRNSTHCRLVPPGTGGQSANSARSAARARRQSGDVSAASTRKFSSVRPTGVHDDENAVCVAGFQPLDVGTCNRALRSASWIPVPAERDTLNAHVRASRRRLSLARVPNTVPSPASASTGSYWRTIPASINAFSVSGLNAIFSSTKR